jgi:putative thioredoxin
MGSSVDIDSSTYATEVDEKSYEKPVLVDFFATWCGPCQILKPMLEKLVKEYDFVLAKIDIDQNPDLADKFGVEGVPDVRIVTKGEMLPGFVGVLPESQLRKLLSHLNLKSELEIGLEAIHEAKAAGNLSQVKKLFDQLFEQYPDNQYLVIESARFLVSLNQLDQAIKMLDTIGMEEQENYAQAQGLKSLIFLKKEAENLAETDLDQQFAKAAKLAIQEDYEDALKLFLEIVSINRKYKEDGARKAMLAVFNLLGEQHPLTQEYQKHLMWTLF